MVLKVKSWVTYVRDGVKTQYNYAYDGEINSLKRRYIETNSNDIKNYIEQYMEIMLVQNVRSKIK